MKVVGEGAAADLRAALGDRGGALEVRGDAVHSTVFLQEAAYQVSIGGSVVAYYTPVQQAVVALGVWPMNIPDECPGGLRVSQVYDGLQQ